MSTPQQSRTFLPGKLPWPVDPETSVTNRKENSEWWSQPTHEPQLTIHPLPRPEASGTVSTALAPQGALALRGHRPPTSSPPSPRPPCPALSLSSSHLLLTRLSFHFLPRLPPAPLLPTSLTIMNQLDMYFSVRKLAILQTFKFCKIVFVNKQKQCLLKHSISKFSASSICSEKKNFFKRSLLFLRRSIAKYFHKPMAIVFTFFKEMEIAADKHHLLLQW